jgi:hypothetical protein
LESSDETEKSKIMKSSKLKIKRSNESERSVIMKPSKLKIERSRKERIER